MDEETESPESGGSGDGSGNGEEQRNNHDDDNVDKLSAAEKGVPVEGLRERAGAWREA